MDKWCDDDGTTYCPPNRSSAFGFVFLGLSNVNPWKWLGSSADILTSSWLFLSLCLFAFFFSCSFFFFANSLSAFFTSSKYLVSSSRSIRGIHGGFIAAKLCHGTRLNHECRFNW